MPLKLIGSMTSAERANHFRQAVRKRDLHVDSVGRGLYGEPSLLAELNSMMFRYPPNISFVTGGLSLHSVVIDVLRPFSKQVNMRKILESKPEAKIILFGEEHGGKNGQRFIASAVEYLVSVGYRAFGSELLRIDNQNLIEAFEKGKIAQRDALLNYISDARNTGVMAKAADTHMEIFDILKLKKVKIVPLSPPHTLNGIEDNLYGHSFELVNRFRDCFMCLAINAGIVEHEKMFVLVGRAHIDVNSGMPNILEREFGYGTIAIALVEREDVEEPFMVEYSPEVRKVIPYFRTLNWREEDPLPQEGDWLVFLPSSGLDK